jgi:cytochrome c2
VRPLLVSAALLTTLLAAGCGAGGVPSANGDKTAGKQLFVSKCGACHTLADAGTTGKVGPDLDSAFGYDRKQGFKDSTIRTVVAEQISMAAAPMPANLVTGQDRDDVADYVASVAGLTLQTSTVAGGTGATVEAPPATTSTPGTTQTQPTTTQAAGGGGPAAVAKGKSDYTSLGCVGCHSIDGSKGTGPTFKGLYGAKSKLTNGQSVTADDAYLLESIMDPDKQIVAGFSPGIMSAVIKPGSVSQPEAQALIAYIKSLK